MIDTNIKLIYLELLKNLSTKLYEEAINKEKKLNFNETDFQNMINKIELVLSNIKNHKEIENYMISKNLENDIEDDILF